MFIMNVKYYFSISISTLPLKQSRLKAHQLILN